RDFLFFYKIDWPVFNVADCCLVCGAIMLVLHAVFVKPPKPDATAATTAAATTPAAVPAPAPTPAG
ncbi:signal peptidase II, partial [Propionibacterium freudenreichii]|uniref:signal peptidase II n=1 Tax=Propionibacterium freudenreichii TaxID=1744 RepID=UPI0038527D3F